MATRLGGRGFDGSLTLFLFPLLDASFSGIGKQKRRENRFFFTHLTAATLPPSSLPSTGYLLSRPSVCRLRVGSESSVEAVLRLYLCPSCRTQEAGSPISNPLGSSLSKTADPNCVSLSTYRIHPHTAQAMGAPVGGEGWWSLPVTHQPDLSSMFSCSSFLHCSMNTKHGSQHISKNAAPSCVRLPIIA